MTTWCKRNLPMMRMRCWIAAVIVAAGLCTPLLLVACSTPSSPLTASLELEGRPALGKPFALRLKMRTLMALTDVKWWFYVPAGMDLLDASREPSIDMEPGRTYVITATARIVENGYHVVEAMGWKETLARSYYARSEKIYMLVEGEDIWLSHSPPPNHWNLANPNVSVVQFQPELVQNRLYLSGALALNQPVTLVYEVTPLVDLQLATVGLTVPTGGLESGEPCVEAEDAALAAVFEFSSHEDGVYRWFGPMKPQQTYSFYVTLIATAAGEGGVRAVVSETGSVGSVSRLAIGTSQSLDLSLYSPSLAR